VNEPAPFAADPTAEQIVIATTVAAPAQSAQIFMALPADVWTNGICRQVAVVLTEKYQHGTPIQRHDLLRECVERSGTDHHAQQTGRFITELGDMAIPPTGLAYYAERLTTLATIRRVYAETLRCGQGVTASATEPNDIGDDMFRTSVTTMRNACDDALVTFKKQPTEPPLSAADLLTGSDEYDWLVPGLLEYTDRLVITGTEGLGKSVIAGQIAATVAAGIHPFSTEPLPRRSNPYRVLVVDCENSRRQLRRRFRKLLHQVDEACISNGVEPADWNTALRFVIRPEGISLTEPRELARMEQAVTATGPDLLVIGPMYRLSKIDVRDEQAAKELTDTIDMLRVRHHLTVVIETHAGHGTNSTGTRQLRPLGSSLFLRWPEFGYGLRPAPEAAHEEHPSIVEVGAWRGARDERNWPKRLRHGSTLPWEPADQDYWGRTPLRDVS
jgi:hypothetical protein